MPNRTSAPGTYPPPTPSITKTPSITASNTATQTATPLSTALASKRNSSIAFSTPCQHAYWTVPSGVREASVYLWGSAGNWELAGGGAHVEGTMYVTPGETLRVTVGGRSSVDATGPAESGFPGGGFASRTGGFSAIARRDISSSESDPFTFLVVAGGGTSGNTYWRVQGAAGYGINPLGSQGHRQLR